MERTNLLSQFFQSKSDANKTLDATAQEQLENDFQKHMTEGEGEKQALNFVDEMCIESLDPDTFAKWEAVKRGLKQVRRMLK